MWSNVKSTMIYSKRLVSVVISLQNIASTHVYLRRITTPRLSAVRARQSGLVDMDDEGNEVQSLEEAIESINIEQFDSPALSPTRLD